MCFLKYFVQSVLHRMHGNTLPMPTMKSKAFCLSSAFGLSGYEKLTVCISVQVALPQDAISDFLAICLSLPFFFLAADKGMSRPTRVFPAFSQDSFWDITPEPSQPHNMHYDAPHGQMSMCKIVSFAIALLVIWWVVQKFDCTRYMRPVSHVVNGMLGSVVSDKSDKSVTDLTPGSTDGKADDGTKMKNDAAVEKFLHAHAHSAVLIYAPWCPHCTTCMPKFCEAAKQAKVPFAVINADLVSPKTLEHFNVRFFPHVARVQKAEDGTIQSTVLDDQVIEIDTIYKHVNAEPLQHFF